MWSPVRQNQTIEVENLLSLRIALSHLFFTVILNVIFLYSYSVFQGFS
jgi:hypothetical protein